MNCQTCRWYDPSREGVYGQCRAAAPVVTQHFYARWPVVMAVDWCAQWKRQPTKRKSAR